MRLFSNPDAGRGRNIDRIGELAAELGLDHAQPSGVEELQEGIRREIRRGADRVLIAGGDGTLHHAVQVLAGTECALAPVALGTGNDLCRSLGLPLEPEAGLRRALAGSARRIDLGRCGARYFAGIAGCGLDGAVLDFLERRSQWFRGPWVYPYALARTLAAFRPIPLTVDCDGRTIRHDAMLAAWSNTGIFGGGMRMAPSAKIDDGLLDLVLVEAMSKARLIALFPHVYSGRHLGRQGVHHLRGKRFRVRAAGSLRLHADGERLAQTQDGTLEVTVADRCLRVIV